MMTLSNNDVVFVGAMLNRGSVNAVSEDVRGCEAFDSLNNVIILTLMV